jgi:4-hydroxy-tetrahydrodipicolinate reductase
MSIAGNGGHTLRVGVIGAKGRMGAQIVEAVQGASDLEFAAGVDFGDDFGVLEGVDVAVDFTNPAVVLDNITWAVGHGVNIVVGTSGFNDERFDYVRSLLGETPKSGVLIASNFSIGAILMMSFAEQAARFYESAEIIELHHPNKVDAPSGTATATAGRIAKARAAGGLGAIPDATNSGLAGARGAQVDGIHVHGVRLRGLVAHQEVLLGSAGETLTIRHDSLDRASFMPGVLTAVRAVKDLPGLTLGIDSLLGL